MQELKEGSREESSAEETKAKGRSAKGKDPRRFEKWRVEVKDGKFEKLKLEKVVFVDEWVAEELNQNTSQLNPYHYYSA